MKHEPIAPNFGERRRKCGSHRFGFVHGFGDAFRYGFGFGQRHDRREDRPFPSPVIRRCKADRRSHLLPPSRGSFRLCSGGSDRFLPDSRIRRCRPMRSRKSISSTHGVTAQDDGLACSSTPPDLRVQVRFSVATRDGRKCLFTPYAAAAFRESRFVDLDGPRHVAVRIEQCFEVLAPMASSARWKNPHSCSCQCSGLATPARLIQADVEAQFVVLDPTGLERFADGVEKLVDVERVREPTGIRPNSGTKDSAWA